MGVLCVNSNSYLLFFFHIRYDFSNRSPWASIHFIIICLFEMKCGRLSGAFIGCSIEGSLLSTRSQENSRFYGSQSISAYDILLGSLPRPPAAAILYHALSNLFLKFER